MTAQTMLDFAGAALPVGTPKTAALIVIDAQEEYRTGSLKISGLAPALDHIGLLLAHWRKMNGTIIHIVHHGKPGGPLFDPDGPQVDIMPEVAPAPDRDERIITKQVPSAFGGTDLDAVLKRHGITQLVFAGFMTHVCISTTARVGHQLGYHVTVASDATGTRDLPDPLGDGVLSAADLHRAELTMLSDIFARIATARAIINA